MKDERNEKVAAKPKVAGGGKEIMVYAFYDVSPE